MTYTLVLTPQAQKHINKADRIIYSIENERVIVTVISMKGHY